MVSCRRESKIEYDSKTSGEKGSRAATQRCSAEHAPGAEQLRLATQTAVVTFIEYRNSAKNHSGKSVFCLVKGTLCYRDVMRWREVLQMQSTATRHLGFAVAFSHAASLVMRGTGTSCNYCNSTTRSSDESKSKQTPTYSRSRQAK
jgi:hypothetical protein